MSTVNTRIKIKHDTTSNWNSATGFIPLSGEIIVYDDYKTITKEVNGENVTKNVPGIKVGDGLAYVQDLPFVDEDLREQLMAHINDSDIHVTSALKTFWNNKLNIDDTNEVVNETLVFNRN